MSSAGASQSGISLVETMIALFVVALLATAGGIMLTQSLRGARLVEDRGSDAQELQTALSVIRDDFSAFVDRPSRSDATSELPTRFEGQPVRFDGRIVTFIRNGWPNPAGHPRSDLQRIEYSFVDGALIRRSWSAPDAGPGTDIAEQTLLNGLENITVRYGREQGWQSDWIVPASSADTPFPDKIELTMSFGEEDTLTALFRLGLRE
ncbi:general secretion pathway protein J [Hyphomonas neptunium ATCC 15444]|uniref:Type II secretion system protein J n=2 Tax=Hyphomonas TaxID=85 RepID=Q0C121_HYPNA|nr:MULTISPECIES: type II secretion system minor pseudopilin GspJ [Hyphomonas]ABI77490.1 general secretion pathway protein J [Hyphomonas neptunium ATCC 15444]KCZ95013.1 general secretion pathway protein J [Hyphomonas hirschiana VP5]